MNYDLKREDPDYDRRCKSVSRQRIGKGMEPMTCGLEKGHKGQHNALGWAIRLPPVKRTRQVSEIDPNDQLHGGIAP